MPQDKQARPQTPAMVPQYQCMECDAILDGVDERRRHKHGYSDRFKELPSRPEIESAAAEPAPERAPPQFVQPEIGEWVEPVMEPQVYEMRCCDCKLTHQMQFAIQDNRVIFRVIGRSDPAVPEPAAQQESKEESK